MKKIAFSFAFLVSLVHGGYVNGLVATVENEPITDYEMNSVMRQMNIDSQKALNVLIRQKLEDAQISALNITVDPFEVNEKISQIISANGLDMQTFQSMLATKGISFDMFKKDIENGLKKEKLYARILNNPSQNITPENARRFYESNLGMFAQFETINIVRYSSNSKEALENAAKSPMSVQPGVNIENLKLESKNLNPQLRYIFLNTKNNTFTPAFGGNGEYQMFYVVSKEGSYVPRFEDVEKEVISAMANQEREIAVADYFNKLRSKANIEIVKR
ncbi:putative SurA domain protein [Campylobacter iguaniorum]|uniref:peptidylprolyl isomerase n=1 Tax=Campylobacter iguaniorum TaxID=1244531 RepID=UPI0007C88E3D|nr:peptidylprolyl isomerase [Campylobacter iguaniorum]ANE36457.1 putative SurA domain protein [Campylobacter iguaniorum]